MVEELRVRYNRVTYRLECELYEMRTRSQDEGDPVAQISVDRDEAELQVRAGEQFGCSRQLNKHKLTIPYRLTFSRPRSDSRPRMGASAGITRLLLLDMEGSHMTPTT